MKMSDFNPTQDMIDATKAVFMAKTLVETITPIVTGHQKQVLEKHRFAVSEKIRKTYTERDREILEYISNPKDSYMMEDSDFTIYHNEVRELNASKGLTVDNPDHCPMLVAEHQLSQAESLLIDVFEPITKIGNDKWVLLKHRTQLIDIILKMMVAKMGAEYFSLKNVMK